MQLTDAQLTQLIQHLKNLVANPNEGDDGPALNTLLGVLDQKFITTAITAFATGGQTSAVAVVEGFNEITVCATAGDSVKLPAASVSPIGATVTVKNNGATSADVFPATSESIDVSAINIAFPLKPKETRTFVKVTAIIWESDEPTYELGTAGTGVTARTTGDGRNFVTVLDCTGLVYDTVATASLAIGKLIYTLPAGAQFIEVGYMNIALQGTGTVDADVPEVGVGTVIATGAVAVLSGTATFEDIIDSAVASDCNGTASVQLLTPDDSLSIAADVKAVHLNMADGWAGEDDITVTGTVSIKWTLMS